MTYDEQLLVTLLDKGLLALLLGLLGIFAARSLEKLKGSLSWGAELMKQRLALARSLVPEVNAAKDAYLQMVLHVASCGGVFKKEYDEIVERAQKLPHLIDEARLLLSKATVKALEALHQEFVIRAPNRGWDWSPQYVVIEERGNVLKVREDDEINEIVQAETKRFMGLMNTVFACLSEDVQRDPSAAGRLD